MVPSAGKLNFVQKVSSLFPSFGVKVAYHQAVDYTLMISTQCLSPTMCLYHSAKFLCIIVEQVNQNLSTKVTQIWSDLCCYWSVCTSYIMLRLPGCLKNVVSICSTDTISGCLRVEAGEKNKYRINSDTSVCPYFLFVTINILRWRGLKFILKSFSRE